MGALHGKLIVCATVAWAVFSPGLHAQLDLRLETPKSSYLQYAPIPVTVHMKNLGGQDLSLEPLGGQPWLELIVQSSDGLVLKPDRAFAPPTVTLRAGEARSLPVDLAPLFLAREVGAYRVRASVRTTSGESLLTESLSFLIGKGEVVWTVPRGEGADRRIYSLIKFYEDPNVGLYLRVEVPEKNQVFSSRRLGPYLPLAKPMAEFDVNGHLHLLYAVAPGQFRLSVVNRDGNPLRDEMRQVTTVKPSLRKGPDGLVDVEGGVVILPTQLRPKLSSLQARAGTGNPAPEEKP